MNYFKGLWENNTTQAGLKTKISERARASKTPQIVTFPYVSSPKENGAF
jgi:hypothetical protein